MSNNPFAGSVPLNLIRDKEKVEKSVDSTSYRSGIQHPVECRSQYQDKTIKPRNMGCTPLRRYPNGQLDVKFVAHQIIDLVHKVKDSGDLTNYEKAILSLILPDQFRDLIAPKIAGTMARMSDEERLMVAIIVKQHMGEELNWNAGYGGGSVPGRSSTRS